MAIKTINNICILEKTPKKTLAHLKKQLKTTLAICLTDVNDNKQISVFHSTRFDWYINQYYIPTAKMKIAILSLGQFGNMVSA